MERHLPTLSIVSGGECADGVELCVFSSGSVGPSLSVWSNVPWFGALVQVSLPRAQGRVCAVRSFWCLTR